MAATLPTAEEVRSIVREELERLLEPIRRSLPPSLVSIERAAEILGVSVATVRRRVKAGDIATKRAGRQIRIDAATLHPVTQAEVVELAARRTGR